MDVEYPTSRFHRVHPDGAVNWAATLIRQSCHPLSIGLAPVEAAIELVEWMVAMQLRFHRGKPDGNQGSRGKANGDTAFYETVLGFKVI